MKFLLGFFALSITAQAKEIVCSTILQGNVRGSDSAEGARGKISLDDLQPSIPWKRELKLEDKARRYFLTFGRDAEKDYVFMESSPLKGKEKGSLHKTHGIEFGPKFYFDVVFPANVQVAKARYRSVEIECKVR